MLQALNHKPSSPSSEKDDLSLSREQTRTMHAITKTTVLSLIIVFSAQFASVVRLFPTFIRESEVSRTQRDAVVNLLFDVLVLDSVIEKSK